MKFEHFKTLFNGSPTFSFEAAMILAGDDRKYMSVRLKRWVDDGRLCALKRGLYGFAQEMRNLVQADLWTSYRLYEPSYVSCERAMHYHRMIPEVVFSVTCVTTRHPVTIRNTQGNFVYRNIKPELFFGYDTIETAHGPIFIATPEKALLDYLWLKRGVKWVPEQLEAELRLQFSEKFSRRRFEAMARKFDSPRLMAAAEVALQVMKAESEGWENTAQELTTDSTHKVSP